MTGLRCFAALNIVFFHFSNPQWFGFLAPVVNAGYASVSYFILLSGFVLGYNYCDRARQGKLDRVRFWKARFIRLYPIYLLSLLLAWKMAPVEYSAHTHGMFWAGMALTPVLLQGWIPSLATFLNTPAWTMSAESFFYFLFPWMARWKKPDRLTPHLAKMAGVWMLGLIPGTLYVIFSPDGVAHPDRWTSAPWLQALKFTPLPHLASFVFGVLLASLDQIIDRAHRLRLFLGLFGFGAAYTLICHASVVPYALLHDGLLMPLFGCIILGLSGSNLALRRLGVSSAGVRGRKQLLLVSAPLQHVESAARIAPSRTHRSQPLGSVDQLRAADRDGVGRAALCGKAGAAATAQVDRRVTD